MCILMWELKLQLVQDCNVTFPDYSWDHKLTGAEDFSGLQSPHWKWEVEMENEIIMNNPNAIRLSSFLIPNPLHGIHVMHYGYQKLFVKIPYILKRDLWYG